MTSSPAVAVVLPAGPGDDVADTIESVVRYTNTPRLIVVVDDRHRGDADVWQSLSGDVRVVPAPPAPAGTRGGLWYKVAAGYRYALAHLDFALLLRLDADALMIEEGSVELAAARFDQEGDDVGLLGSYRTGPDGLPRSFAEAAALVRADCGTRASFRPRTRRALRAIVAAAQANGYEPGEHVLGAACFQRRTAVDAIAAHGWLEAKELKHSQLADDHLLSLLTVAAGFRIADFGRPGDPLALQWKGLPAAPEELLERGARIVHSVRSYEDRGEAEIREFFARERRST